MASGGISDMMEEWKCERCTYSNKKRYITCKVCRSLRVERQFSQLDDIETDSARRVSVGSFESEDDHRYEDGGLRTEEWTCTVCTYENNHGSVICEQCLTPGSHMTRQKPQKKHTVSDDEEEEDIVRDIEGWACSQCTFINDYENFRCDQCFSPRTAEAGPEDVDLECSLENEIRMILIGRTGSGKSATGNCILNKEVFQSEVAHSSVTKKCKRGTSDRFDKKLLVVDTPGLFDTGMDNESVTVEILKCVGITAPGPHAILLIISIGRFTPEERETIELLRNAFGKDMNRYVILIFTRKDDLDLQGKCIDDILTSAPPHLRSIVSECQNRYLAWNNNANDEEKELQSKQLIDMIGDMVENNGGEYYHSEIFNETETVIQLREIEIRNEYELDYKQQVRKLRRQMSIEYHQKVDECREREMALKRQLQILQKNSEIENEAVQQQLANLRDEMNVYTYNMDVTDTETSHRMSTLKKQIADIQERIFEIQQYQRELRQQAEEECFNKEQIVDGFISVLNVREDVRDEIEQGTQSILSRIMSRLKGLGSKISSGFKSIYRSMKTKLSWK